MASVSDMICQTCGQEFCADFDDGLDYHLLRCNRCGGPSQVAFADLVGLRSAYVRGLPVPDLVLTASHNPRFARTQSGAPMSEAEYRLAIEASTGPHDCGGRFEFDAAPRCPKCRSADMDTGRDGSTVVYG